MSQETYRQRSRVIDGVLDDIEKSHDWRIPERWQLDVELMFGGEAEFALALYPRWFATLTARLDPVLEEQAPDLPEAAARVAMQLAMEQPALFGLLAAYTDHPVLEPVHQRERQYLYWAPGTQLAALAPQLGELLHGGLVPVS